MKLFILCPYVSCRESHFFFFDGGFPSQSHQPQNLLIFIGYALVFEAKIKRAKNFPFGILYEEGKAEREKEKNKL